MNEREVESQGVVSYFDVLLRQARAEGRAEALAEVVATLNDSRAEVEDSFNALAEEQYLSPATAALMELDDAIAAVRELGEMSELVQQLNERLTQVTAERDEERALREDYQLKLAFTAGDLAFAKTELSELRARVERAKAAIDGASPDHGYKHDGCLGCKLLAVLNEPAPVFTAMGLDEPEFPTIKRGEK